MRNKIDAVLKMGQPTNQTKVRSFMGAVTFYKSLWPCWLHILAQLHKVTDVGRSIWSPSQEKAFLTLKAMIVADAMSYYSDLNKPCRNVFVLVVPL